MHAWSQLTSLGLATAGMVLALIPRTTRRFNSSAFSFSSQPSGPGLSFLCLGFAKRETATNTGLAAASNGEVSGF